MLKRVMEEIKNLVFLSSFNCSMLSGCDNGFSGSLQNEWGSKKGEFFFPTDKKNNIKHLKKKKKRFSVVFCHVHVV